MRIRVSKEKADEGRIEARIYDARENYIVVASAPNTIHERAKLEDLSDFGVGYWIVERHATHFEGPDKVMRKKVR